MSRLRVRRVRSHRGRRSIRVSEWNRHFPGLPEYDCRLIGLGVKVYAQWELFRSWPARRHDDGDPGPSLGNATGQVRPAHRSGHAYVGEKQANVRICFEESHSLVRIYGLEDTVSRIQKHIGCPHSLKNIVVDDQNEGVGKRIGHPRPTYTNYNSFHI